MMSWFLKILNIQLPYVLIRAILGVYLRECESASERNAQASVLIAV